MAKPRKKPEKVGIDSVTQTNTKAIVLAVSGVILLLALIAVLFAVANNNEDDNASGVELVEFRPVTVTGDPLPPQYSDPNSQQLNEAIGAQAPDLNGSGFDGSPVNITKDGRGKALVFLAHWCQHCRNEVPLLSDWIPENKSRYPGVDIYAIATSSAPTRANYPPSSWLKKEDWPTPVMADDNKYSAGNAYGLGSFPYFVFLDGQNKVVTRTSGEIGMTDFGSLMQRTQDAVDGKTTATTAPTATTAAPQSMVNQ